MNCKGKVLSLFISDRASNQRIELKELLVDEKGILNDKFYDKDIQRSVLITSNESYQLAQKYSIHIVNGFLGENILLDCNPYKLSPGTKLQIGEIILQISQNCTICNSLAVVDSRLPKILKNDRGIFARVLKEGVIKKGDIVQVLMENEEFTRAHK